MPPGDTVDAREDSTALAVAASTDTVVEIVAACADEDSDAEVASMLTASGVTEAACELSAFDAVAAETETLPGDTVDDCDALDSEAAVASTDTLPAATAAT